MAERRDTPDSGPLDTSWDEAVDTVGAAATPHGYLARAPRFPSPLLDAYSVALSTIDGEVRAPDPRVERQLSPMDAIAAASGLMVAPPPRVPRWWGSLPGPAVTSADGSAAAILPSGSGANAVAGGTRVRTRFHGAEDAGETVVVTGSLPPGASWRALIWWSVRGRLSQLRMVLLLSLLGGTIGLLLPIATSGLFGVAVPSGNAGLAAGILLAFALGSAGGAMLIVARNILLIRLRQSSDARLAPGVMAHLLRLPLPFFRRMQSGEILNRSLAVETARETVDDGVLALVLTSVFGLVNLVYLLAIDVVLGIAMCFTIFIVVALVSIFQMRARGHLEQYLEDRSVAESSFVAIVGAIVPIRVSGAESRAMARWARLFAPQLSTLERRLVGLARTEPVLIAGPIFMNAVLVIAVVAGRGSFTASAFMGAYVAVAQLTIAMGLLAQNLNTLVELGPVLERVVPITSTAVERPGPTRAPGPLQGRIQLTDIVFGYDPDQPPLLDGVNITIEPGEFVAVVGPSGSGKSTVMRLILGFETPWSGVVSFDGQDLADLDVAAVRRQMGTVLQTSMPFGTTYRECICGPLQIDDEHLWKVIAESGLEPEVRARGLDVPIGDRGGAISGGQRQRLMIARALASDPRVILLDEATSALDNMTQSIVMRSILGQPVTRVAIAHRLTTVERADRILVVSGGRIVEEGPPADLLASGGHFARLAARQEY
ncbi:MAG: ATP-binding cassette domain-containing protein [Candidatus Nanopelagicales bacterium]|nr:ATP-binding cassette domain-containing protein [Candidatus Nanopelagicales bacterium]